jgi:hypothetical protein
MTRFTGSLAALASVVVAGASWAQIVTPPVTGPAQGAYQQLHPLSPLDQVRRQATQQAPPLPMPPKPGEQWVPERRILVPETGRELLVPGHYERRLSDQQYAVPSLPAIDPGSGRTVTSPGGERPPAELRQSP